MMQGLAAHVLTFAPTLAKSPAYITRNRAFRGRQTDEELQANGPDFPYPSRW